MRGTGLGAYVGRSAFGDVRVPAAGRGRSRGRTTAIDRGGYVEAAILRTSLAVGFGSTTAFGRARRVEAAPWHTTATGHGLDAITAEHENTIFLTRKMRQRAEDAALLSDGTGDDVDV